MKKNFVKEKSFVFAIQIIQLVKFLQNNRREFILSKQLMRSGTAIGALISESAYAESKADFIHKLAIARKECNETIYWLELLEKTQYINTIQFEIINNAAIEILKILTSSIKTSKDTCKLTTNN